MRPQASSESAGANLSPVELAPPSDPKPPRDCVLCGSDKHIAPTTKGARCLNPLSAASTPPPSSSTTR